MQILRNMFFLGAKKSIVAGGPGATDKQTRHRRGAAGPGIQFGHHFEVERTYCTGYMVLDSKSRIPKYQLKKTDRSQRKKTSFVSRTRM